MWKLSCEKCRLNWIHKRFFFFAANWKFHLIFSTNFTLTVFKWKAKNQSRKCQLTLVKIYPKLFQDFLFIFFVQLQTKQWLWSSVTFSVKISFSFFTAAENVVESFSLFLFVFTPWKKNSSRKTTKGHKTMKWKVVRFLVFYE